MERVRYRMTEPPATTTVATNRPLKYLPASAEMVLPSNLASNSSVRACACHLKEAAGLSNIFSSTWRTDFHVSTLPRTSHDEDCRQSRRDRMASKLFRP